jgi:hypothetical protein
LPGQVGTPPPDEEEVQITFARARNGKKRSIPVWFTLKGGRMELLPMYGTKSRWFIDIEKSGTVELRVKDWKKTVKPKIIRDMAAIGRIKERFAVKYGEDKVNRYYPTCNAAFEVTL